MACKMTEQEVQDELAAQALASPGGKSEPVPPHPAMLNSNQASYADADNDGDAGGDTDEDYQ